MSSIINLIIGELISIEWESIEKRIQLERLLDFVQHILELIKDPSNVNYYARTLITDLPIILTKAHGKLYYTYILNYIQIPHILQYVQTNQKITYIPFPRLLYSLAYSLIRSYKSDLAIKVIQKTIQLDPKNGDYYDSYGEILLMSNNYVKAIPQFEKALEINPDAHFIHQTYIKLGNCYLKLQKNNLALDYLEKGKKIAEKRENDRWIDRAIILIKEAKKNIERKRIIESY